jgi:hypothetical protein
MNDLAGPEPKWHGKILSGIAQKAAIFLTFHIPCDTKSQFVEKITLRLPEGDRGWQRKF